MREVYAYPRLGAKHERELFRKWREEGDEKAEEAVITSNLRHVVSIAAGYGNTSAGIEDLIAEGNPDLLAALDRYDPAHLRQRCGPGLS